MAKVRKHCKTFLKIEIVIFFVERVHRLGPFSEGYIDKEFPKGISLRTKTAKGYDDKGQKRLARGPAGAAHFSRQLANPCIYEMTTTTTTSIRPSPHKYEAQHAGICHRHVVIVAGTCLLACLLVRSFDCSFVCLPVGPSVYWLFCLFVRSSVHFFVRLFVCSFV